MLQEDFLKRSINRKWFPFVLPAWLLGLALLMLLCIAVMGNEEHLILMVGGTELLLYLISNALCMLVVRDFDPYFKRTMLAYLLNLLVLGAILAIFMGGLPENVRDSWPVFLALIVSFFLSLGLVVLIRQILTILRQN
jgi:hypothetical protein